MATSDDTICTLSNILSGILYRFRVTAIVKDGLSSFPSDPSEPFVIDIPGVQVKNEIKKYLYVFFLNIIMYYIYELNAENVLFVFKMNNS